MGFNHTLRLPMQDTLFLYLFGLVMQCLIFIPYIMKAPVQHQSGKDVFWRVANLLISAAPPGIPLVLCLVGGVAGVVLKRHGIELLFPEIIQRGAAVDVVCFDKTGTLTDSTVRCSFCQCCNTAQQTSRLWQTTCWCLALL